MGEILKAANDRLPFNIHGTMVIPTIGIPSARVMHAIENGIQNNFLIKSFNGLGDQVCSEPAIRYGIERFKGVEFTVESYNPELYQHLSLKGNFKYGDLTESERSRYFAFKTQFEPDHLAGEFFLHMFMNCVDHPALNMWRFQLPVEDRNVILAPVGEQLIYSHGVNSKTDVVVHPGRNWKSKTFPKEFWDKVLSRLKEQGARPLIIGGKCVFDDKGGTVEVDTSGCVDLRGIMSVMQTTAVLQSARVVLTNDSGPLHLAASGSAWIGYISTVKHPDFITHWRPNLHGKNEWGWRMENHSLGGLWETTDIAPNHNNCMQWGEMDHELMMSYLPDAIAYADWAFEKLK